MISGQGGTSASNNIRNCDFITRTLTIGFASAATIDLVGNPTKTVTVTVPVSNKRRTQDADLLDMIQRRAIQEAIARGDSPTDLEVGAGLLSSDQKVYEYAVHYTAVE